MKNAKNKVWKVKDIEYLRLMYPVASQTVIARELGISYSAVKNAMQRFRITKPPKGERLVLEMQQHINVMKREIEV